MKTLMNRALVAFLPVALLVSGCGDGGTLEGGGHGELAQASGSLELTVPGDHPTIQAALDAAGPGGIVTVAAGSYEESLNVPEGVTLRGAGTEATIVFGAIKGYAGGVTIEDLTVDGALAPTAYAAIDLLNGQAQVSRVAVRNGQRGIVVEKNTDGATTPTVVDRVLVEKCAVAGIMVTDGTNVSITNAIVSKNPGHGVVVNQTVGNSGVVIAHGLLFSNGFGVQGGAGFRGEANGFTLANSIVTSNNNGVSCTGDCPVTHSVVWGNVLNYEGTAVADATHIKKDPRFASASSGDFSLLFDSPAVDAGDPAFGADHDFTGLSRPMGSGYDVGPFEYNSGDTTITIAITEIMANPLDESTGEYVELTNYGDAAVDVAGFVLDDGDAKDVLTGWQGGPTSIPAKAYAVILDPDYAGQYAIPAEGVLLTIAQTSTLGSGLSNSDPVRLFAADGKTPVDTYSFPFDAGNGVSVEKDSLEDGDTGSNWVPSPCGSTPGAGNCASLPPNVSKLVHIAVNEVMANPLDETTGEFIELYNFAPDPIDVGGMVISDGDSTDVIVGVGGGPTVLASGQLGIVLDPDYAGQYAIPADAVLLTVATSTTIGNGLSTNDPITLYEANGSVVIDTYTHTFDPGNGVSVEKADFVIGDIASNFVASTCDAGSSPGAVNCATAQGTDPIKGATIAITEVMANPLDEDTGEFVELLNYGTEPIDLLGYRFSDGDQEDVLQAFGTSSTVLEPMGYAVIVDAEYKGQYAIPPEALLLTTGDTTIGSGLSTTDPLKLRPPKGAKAADTFLAPFNPGNGLSAEKIDLVVGDVPENWTPSPCNASPGKANCVWPGTGGGDESLSTTQITVSEVMANPIDEGAGEYVELFNAGPVGVDLGGFRLSDGDSLDTLTGWKGGPTLLMPGQFAVVLDPDYSTGYKIPAGALRLSVSDTTVGNGLSTSDPITIYEPDGITVVATFSFPSNPGNGKSIEKVALTSGDSPANWVVSTCSKAAGDTNDYASPGARNCSDPHGDLTGTKPLGQPCPFGAADCLTGLCGIDLLTLETFCTDDCTTSACPQGFTCTDSIDANYGKLCVPVAGSLPQIVINEVLYDAVGTDAEVFVELMGPPGAILDGLTLVGVNGSNGGDYNAIALTGTIGTDGLFVIGHPGASAAIMDAADMLSSKVDFQNGPDSIQLRKGDNVLDAVGYGNFGTSAVFAGEGVAAPGTDANAGQAIGRLPDGVDTGDNAADFIVLPAPTPGATNG